MPQTERAWVMVVRRRINGESFSEAEKKFRDLRDKIEWGSGVKDMATVLGQTDIMVVIEAPSVYEMHQQVQFMHKHLGERIRSTVTSLAVRASQKYPKIDPERKEARFFLALNCTPGHHDQIVEAVRKVKGVLVADVVFGKYDIIALVRYEKSRKAVLDEIANICIVETDGKGVKTVVGGVEKTTTLQPTDEVD